MAQAIALLWGHAEMNAYFDRIWAGDADVDFEPDVLSDLMLLAQMHRRLVPAPTPQVVLPSQRHTATNDPWDSSFRRRKRSFGSRRRTEAGRQKQKALTS